MQVKVPAGDVAATAADSINISFPQPVLSVTALAKQCPDCSLKFATKTTLNLHRLKNHVVALKQLPCPQCKQVSKFATKTTLNILGLKTQVVVVETTALSTMQTGKQVCHKDDTQPLSAHDPRGGMRTIALPTGQTGKQVCHHRLTIHTLWSFLVVFVRDFFILKGKAHETILEYCLKASYRYARARHYLAISSSQKQRWYTPCFSWLRSE